MLIFPFGILPLFAQDFDCGVEISPEKYQALAQEVQAIENFSYPETFPPAFIPVNFTIIRDDEGNGVNDFVNQSTIDNALNLLNANFEDLTGMHFVQCGGVTYINNSELSVFPKVSLLPYSTSEINVVVNPNLGSSFATLPCNYTQQDPCDDLDLGLVLSSGFRLNTVTFSHEVGHHFGLVHTFDGSGNYNLPVESDQIDHPYGILDNLGITLTSPRELVIRQDDESADFDRVNCLHGGDFVCDTPPDCRSNQSNTWPSPNDDNWPNCTFSTPCASGCAVSNCEMVGDYVDYNMHDLQNPVIGSAPKNFMSYWGACREEFTQGQAGRMFYYFATRRIHQYDEPKCNTLNDEVALWDTNLGVNKVRITNSYPTNEDHFLRTLTMVDGQFSGTLHENTVTSEVIKYSNTFTNLEQDFYEYSYYEWLNGITMADICAINEHILNVNLLPNGYAQIAADANNSGNISTLDKEKLRRLLLEIDTELSNFDQPWRFVPEYIPFNHGSEFHANPFNMSIVSGSNNAAYLEADWEYTISDGNNGQSGFDAIKIGDVTGDASPESPNINYENPVFVVIEQTIEGNQAKYNFKVEGFEDIIGYQMEIDFDKFSLDYFSYLERDLSGVIEDYFGTTDAEQGIIRTLWYDGANAEARTLPNNSEIFQLIFDGTGNFSGATVNLVAENAGGQRIKKQTNQRLKNYAVGKNRRLRPIIQKVHFDSPISTVEAFPNPFTDELNLSIELTDTDLIEIEVVNVVGQQILQTKKLLQQGKNTIVLSQLTNLPKGILFVKTTCRGNSIIKKVIRN